MFRNRRGEEGDLVALTHELLRQPGDDPLGPAVEFGRNRFGQRRNLRNPHRVISSLLVSNPAGVNRELQRRLICDSVL